MNSQVSIKLNILYIFICDFVLFILCLFQTDCLEFTIFLFMSRNIISSPAHQWNYILFRRLEKKTFWILIDLLLVREFVCACMIIWCVEGRDGNRNVYSVNLKAYMKVSRVHWSYLCSTITRGPDAKYKMEEAVKFRLRDWWPRDCYSHNINNFFLQ